MAAVVAIRSGHAALRAELETHGATAACRMLSEMGDGALSRRVGLALLHAVAQFCESKGSARRAIIEKLACVYQHHMDTGTLAATLPEWRAVNSLADSRSQPLNDIGYYTLGAVVEWLTPGDWEDDELAEDDLEEAAPGCAARVLECFEEAYVRADDSVRYAVRVAEVAIRREQDWRRGTGTQFDLVEGSVTGEVGAIIEETRAEVASLFNDLAKSVIRTALERA